MKIDWKDGVQPILIFLLVLAWIIYCIPGCVKEYRRAIRVSNTLPDYSGLD